MGRHFHCYMRMRRDGMGWDVIQVLQMIQVIQVIQVLQVMQVRQAHLLVDFRVIYLKLNPSRFPLYRQNP